MPDQDHDQEGPFLGLLPLLATDGMGIQSWASEDNQSRQVS